MMTNMYVKQTEVKVTAALNRFAPLHRCRQSCWSSQWSSAGCHRMQLMTTDNVGILSVLAGHGSLISQFCQAYQRTSLYANNLINNSWHEFFCRQIDTATDCKEQTHIENALGMFLVMPERPH